MKIFKQFYQTKTGELLIKFHDDAMTFKEGTMVFNLQDVKDGKVKYSDIENQLEDFPESSRMQIKNAFDLLKTPSKQICLRNIEKS